MWIRKKNKKKKKLQTGKTLAILEVYLLQRLSMFL